MIRIEYQSSSSFRTPHLFVSLWHIEINLYTYTQSTKGMGYIFMQPDDYFKSLVVMKHLASTSDFLPV